VTNLDLVLVGRDGPTELLLAGAIPWIQEGCAREAEWDMPGILRGVAAGQFQLWACWQREPPLCKGVFVTRISTNHRGEQIAWDVLFAGEDLDAMLPLLDGIEDGLRRLGCIKFRIIGRLGWQKKLPGYRPRAIMLEKRLT
jgi:hypothetical protein